MNVNKRIPLPPEESPQGPGILSGRAVLRKIHKERCVICVAIELKIKVLPHLSTHTPDSLLKSVMPSGQKQPSVVKFKDGSLGLALKKKRKGLFSYSLDHRRYLLSTKQGIFSASLIIQSAGTYLSSQVGCSAGPQGL